MDRKWTAHDEPKNQLHCDFPLVTTVMESEEAHAGSLIEDPLARECDSRCEGFKLTARETMWQRGCVDGQVESTGVSRLDIPLAGQRLVRVTSKSADLASGVL